MAENRTSIFVRKSAVCKCIKEKLEKSFGIFLAGPFDASCKTEDVEETTEYYDLYGQLLSSSPVEKCIRKMQKFCRENHMEFQMETAYPSESVRKIIKEALKMRRGRIEDDSRTSCRSGSEIMF